MSDKLWSMVRGWDGGRADLRRELPDINGRYGRFSTRPLTGVTQIAVHHTASPKSTTWESVYRLHTDQNPGGRGWSGTGYHFGIRDGQIAYLGDIGTSRACVADHNLSVICVCISGNYETDQIDPRDRVALVGLVEDIRAFYQREFGKTLRVVGHRDLGQTACPGRNLISLVREIDTGGAVAPPAPPVDRPSKDDIAFAMQSAVLSINPEAALFRRMQGHNHFPIGPEKQRGGWTMQPSASASTGARRVYYCKTGDWGRVLFVEIP